MSLCAGIARLCLVLALGFASSATATASAQPPAPTGLKKAMGSLRVRGTKALAVGKRLWHASVVEHPYITTAVWVPLKTAAVFEIAIHAGASKEHAIAAAVVLGAKGAAEVLFTNQISRHAPKVLAAFKLRTAKLFGREGPDLLAKR